MPQKLDLVPIVSSSSSLPKKKLDLKPLDLEPIEENADDIIGEAKKSLAKAPPSFTSSIDKNIKPIARDEASGDYLEPTTFWGGFGKSIKDQLLGATVGNEALRGAAHPGGEVFKNESKIDTLTNIGNLLLPSGAEGAVNAGRELFGKRGNLDKVVDAAKTAEKVELPKKLEVKSEIPVTKEPIRDIKGREIAPAQELVDNPHPNYPNKGDDIFKRMGMGIEKPENPKLPIRIKDGKQYLKEITKENVDKIYNAGYELGNDGQIVKKSVENLPVEGMQLSDTGKDIFRKMGKGKVAETVEKPLTAPVDSAIPSFGSRRKSLDIKPLETTQPKQLLPGIDDITEMNAGLSPTTTPPIKTSALQKIYDLPRGLMSVDPPFVSSAAFRQGNFYVGTKPWFQAWGKAFRAYGSKAASDAMDAQRLSNPLFKESTAPVVSKTGKPIIDKATGLPKTKRVPSIAEEAGIRMGDLKKYSKRDDAIRGELAEKIPLYGKLVAGSNRAYNAFVNHLSESAFTDLFTNAEKLYEEAKRTGKDKSGFFTTKSDNPELMNPRTNNVLLKQLGEIVNTSLKRGTLGAEAGPINVQLEKHARLLSNTFFSPRNIASEARMLNPSTYVMSSPQVRRAYLEGMARRVAMWTTFAGLAKYTGASVSTDPDNSDFGKIKIGDTRIDLPGGLQQFLVLAHRMKSGQSTSSTSGKTTKFGQGFKPETRGSTVARFMVNRLHPTAKFGVDALFADEKHPFHTIDKSIQLAAPMFFDDMMDTMRKNPELSPIIMMLSGSGIGTQSYERGGFGKSTYFPENLDYNIGENLKRRKQ
jgi:hypothetical protein